MDARWPHHGTPDGWFYDPHTRQVGSRTSSFNRIEFARESQAYLKARQQAVEAEKAFRRFISPNPQIERPPPASSASTMRKKTRGRPKRFRRRPRIMNAALSARRLPFRQVLLVEAATANQNTGLIEHSFKISEMAKEYMTTFEEFRCTGFSVRFVPNNSTTAEGLYSAILLDQSGFDGASRSAATWFPRVGDMPGSVVRHCSSGFILRWRPTEPTSRNFLKSHNNETAVVIASLFIYGSTADTVIKGALVIQGTILCRGEYYSASSRVRRLNLADQEQLQEMTLEDLAL